jgi:hypothetical protein
MHGDMRPYLILNYDDICAYYDLFMKFVVSSHGDTKTQSNLCFMSLIKITNKEHGIFLSIF